MVECWPRSEGGRSPHPGRLQACPQHQATRTSGGGSLFPTLAWTPKVRLWAGRGPDFWGWTCPAEPLPLCGPPLRFPTMPPTWTRHLFAGPDEEAQSPRATRRESSLPRGPQQLRPQPEMPLPHARRPEPQTGSWAWEARGRLHPGHGFRRARGCRSEDTCLRKGGPGQHLRTGGPSGR